MDTILETLFGIHIVFQITCLSPCSIDRRTWALKKSRLLEIYSLITIAVCLTIALFNIFSVSNHSVNASVERVEFSQIVGIRVSLIASISEGFLRRNELRKIYQQFKQIDYIFERSLNIDVNNKKFRRTSILYGSMMACMYLFTQIFTLISNILSHKDSFILHWFFYLFALLICNIRYFQVYTYIRILNLRCDLLVNVLNQINLKRRKCEVEEGDNSMDNVETPFAVKSSFVLRDFPVDRRNCCNMADPELRKLLIVRDIYNRLFYLSEMMNRYFGISILINVGNDFISITSNLYWIFYNLHDFNMNADYILITVCISVWTMPHFVNVALLAVLCEKAVQKTKQIAGNLHHINIDICNDNHNTVIQQFSLQLLHQTISITAAGFFRIDCTLLYTIITATTTYLIILIQFHMH